MVGIERVKRAVVSMAMRLPVYKLVGNSEHRNYLAVQYLNHRDSKKIPDFISQVGRLPTFRYSTTLMALRALDARGDLDRVKKGAAEALSMYPEKLKAYLMLSDVAGQEGDYDLALSYARKGWMLTPGSLAAASRVVRLGYITGCTEQADSEALLALRRFKANNGLLWIACKYCRSREQLEKIITLVRSPRDTPKKISGLARPLAVAALRSRSLDIALELYVEASLIELRGAGLAKPVVTKRLAGKGGGQVLQELREVLESEGVPFFFAAGTALGLVRNGKPLDHDNDIDVGIFNEDWNREQLIRAFSRHPNFDLDDVDPGSPKVGVVHRGGANIDLFKFYREGGGVYHDAIFVRWRNSPFTIERTALESGDIVYLPSQVDRYLTENYGDWRIPNSNFDAFTDGPNAEVTWPEYMVVHKVRKAYRSLREGSLIAARQELEGLQPVLGAATGGVELMKELIL